MKREVIVRSEMSAPQGQQAGGDAAVAIYTSKVFEVQ